jgi:hypothetical protein
MNHERGRGPTRRALLIQSALLFLLACSKEGSNGPARSNGRSLPSFTEIESMRIIGMKYLELRPGANLPALLEALDPARGFEVIDREIRAQYASGDVVQVEGFPLALTEARLYAAVALGARPQ